MLWSCEARAILCLSAGKIRQSGSNNRGGPDKLVEARLSVRKDQESSFHHCGGPAKLM